MIGGRYELDAEPIGSGGMGEVWGGRDTRLDRPVAVKFVRLRKGRGSQDDEENSDLVRRFVRESRITARLEHPGVPAIYDVGTEEGAPYLVMQRVHGRTVADLIDSYGPLPIGWVAAIVAQTCSVLSAAHAASLVHRDLKPGNLVVGPDGSVKVLDFGLAVGMDSTEFSQITHSGSTIGTPQVMAPEQALASRSEPRTDLYALGCTMHQMLTGSAVFSGSSHYAVMHKQVVEAPVPVNRLRPDVPVDLSRLVLSMLAKKPADRPRSAAVIYQQVLPFVTGLSALPDGTGVPDSSLGMYVHALDRIRHGGQPSVGSDRTPPPASPPRRSVATATGLSEVRDPQERFGRAEKLFDDGEFRRARPEYAELAARLAGAAGESDPDGRFGEMIRRCRVQEATCNALIGETTTALRQLFGILAAERERLGPDDPEVFELRKQIGLLQIGAGQHAEATDTLRELLDDQIRVNGNQHGGVESIKDLLDGLRRSGRG